MRSRASCTARARFRLHVRLVVGAAAVVMSASWSTGALRAHAGGLVVRASLNAIPARHALAPCGTVPRSSSWWSAWTIRPVWHASSMSLRAPHSRVAWRRQRRAHARKRRPKIGGLPRATAARGRGGPYLIGSYPRTGNLLIQSTRLRKKLPRRTREDRSRARGSSPPARGPDGEVSAPFFFRPGALAPALLLALLGARPALAADAIPTRLTFAVVPGCPDEHFFRTAVLPTCANRIRSPPTACNSST